MDSERFAAILGFIVAVAVLAAAFYYVPPGSSNKPAVQTAAPAVQAAPATTPSAPRGPVVRDVPQQ
jgi:hypothetical protein